MGVTLNNTRKRWQKMWTLTGRSRTKTRRENPEQYNYFNIIYYFAIKCTLGNKDSVGKPYGVSASQSNDG